MEAAQRLVCKEEEARKSFLVVPYSSPVVRPQASLCVLEPDQSLLLSQLLHMDSRASVWLIVSTPVRSGDC